MKNNSMSEVVAVMLGSLNGSVEACGHYQISRSMRTNGLSPTSLPLPLLLLLLPCPAAVLLLIYV